MVVGAIAVVDVTSAEVYWASIGDCRHSIHFVTAEKRGLDARLANSMQINRLDLLSSPIRPEVVIVCDGETEGVCELVSNDARCLRVCVET